MASPTPTPSPTASPTLIPTPTPTPHAELLAFETYRDGNAEIYLLDLPSGALANLTRHPAGDRHPAWRPDGRALAFESHRDGNWDLYLLDLTTGVLTRLTDHLAYDGAPAWSPDGAEIAFESNRDGNLEIYAIPAAGGEPRRLTTVESGDYGPAWSPDGQAIAFTSWRDGDKEIYLLPAAGGEARNLTRNPADDEDPAWSPDGAALAFTSWRDVDAQTGNRNAGLYRLALEPGPSGLEAGEHKALTPDNPWPDLDAAWYAEGDLVWAAYDLGPPFETYDPYRPGDYNLYRTAPDGPIRLTANNWDDRHPALAPPGAVPLDAVLEWLSLEPTPAAVPDLTPEGSGAQVVEVPGVLAGYSGQPVRVNARVAPSLAAWQADLLGASGWDFLATTLGAWRPIDAVRRKELYRYDYGYLSWHKAGRALDLALEYKVDGADQLRLSREDLGENVYWRLYLRTARQDGSQGEPLKENPWLFWWHIVPDQDPAAYDAGGKRLPIPSGYYVDVTALAKRHGWERIACYAIEGDYHWQTDSNGTEYWHYERTDGLTWWEAMLQIYPPDELETHAGWDAGLQHAQSEAMMRSKGIPEP